jgi:hypothetical protein
MPAMILRSTTRFVLFVYLSLITASAALAVTRLSDSSEMPGLQAIEVVVLALPWSLALGVEPFSHYGWSTMIAIVVIGLVLNALLLGLIARFFDCAGEKIG